MPYVNVILGGIKNLEPIPKGTIPLVAPIVKSLVKISKKIQNTWFMHLIAIMTIFAWAFCLRCSEYTKTEYWDAPKVTDISFTISKTGVKCLNYQLDRRKNRIHDEVEPISIPCTCADFDLCGYCTMVGYLKDRRLQNIQSEYLFAYEYRGTMKPMSASSFRRELALILKGYFGISYDRSIHRAHGFRYGGITDLGTIGIPLEWIRRISGHAPQSKVLESYLKVAPDDVASLIKRRMSS